MHRRSVAKKWARLALKLGLLLTDAKLWSSLNEQLRDRMDDVGDAVKRGYENTADRLDDARGALQGESHWVAHTASFLGGVGLGVGLGMLFAPSSGQETRAALREGTMGVVSDVTGYRSARQATGTAGD